MGDGSFYLGGMLSADDNVSLNPAANERNKIFNNMSIAHNAVPTTTGSAYSTAITVDDVSEQLQVTITF